MELGTLENMESSNFFGGRCLFSTEILGGDHAMPMMSTVNFSSTARLKRDNDRKRHALTQHREPT